MCKPFSKGISAFSNLCNARVVPEGDMSFFGLLSRRTINMPGCLPCAVRIRSWSSLEIIVISGNASATFLHREAQMRSIRTARKANVSRKTHIVTRLAEQANQKRIDGIVVQVQLHDCVISRGPRLAESCGMVALVLCCV